MYIEIGTLILVFGLYLFVTWHFRNAVILVMQRLETLDNQVAEAISKLPLGMGGDFEPPNMIQAAIGNLINSMAENKIKNNNERDENGRFVKARIISPEENKD
tara:strand:- start:1007 stop:1315 length:309 start_codon:yes stop_codon:yes gene_type:complete